MKALITAGGHGTRLRPLTYTVNKHLIPLANKPMIFFAIEKIAAVGIKDVAININPGDKEIKAVCGDGSKWGIKLSYIEQKGGALGLAHIIKNAKDFLGKDKFIFYLGDNIVLSDLKEFVDEFESKKFNCFLALSRVRDPQRFGVPEINERGEIVKIVEKPEKPMSDFAVTGIYIYDHHIIEAAENIKPSNRGEYEISDAHQYLLDHGFKIGYKEITGWWKDTGKPEDLLEGNQLLLNQIEGKIKGKVNDVSTVQGKVFIDEGAQVTGRSFIRGPVSIGKNTMIKNSYIGPYTSIGSNVEIYGSEIEHSIVFDEADIFCNKKITDSLLGRNCSVLDSTKSLPPGHRLFIGENSFVEL